MIDSKVYKGKFDCTEEIKMDENLVNKINEDAFCRGIDKKGNDVLKEKDVVNINVLKKYGVKILRECSYEKEKMCTTIENEKNQAFCKYHGIKNENGL